MNDIPWTALRIPLAFVCLLSANSALAQQRVAPPFVESTDVKTAPEPNQVVDRLPPREASSAFVGPASARNGAAPTPHAIDPAGPAPRRFSIDHDKMEYDTPREGALWARGARYKAGFESAIATYYPLFTPAQPQHYPIVLSPDRVTLGGEALAIEGAGVAARDHDRISFDRASFVESYDMCATSIEQTFTFSTLSRAGELVVHVPLSVELAPHVCADGLEMKNEFGRVTYGHATAIDARGNRWSAATTIVEDGVEIRVDAAFLAHAVLPLVVDPLVTTFAIDNTSFDDYLGDVSYDVTNNRWLAVYDERVTVSDTDAYWVMLNASGVGMFGGYVNSDTNSWDRSRCANVRFAQQFMVVGAVYNGSSNIRGRQISAAISSIGPEIAISGSESGNKGQPQIGGDPFPDSSSAYCVTYDRYYSPSDNDILARLVTTSGTLVGSGPIYLSNSGGTTDDTSSISRSNNGGIWTVAWTRYNSVSSADIWAGRIGFSGVISTLPFQLTSGSYDDAVSVSTALSGSERTMIVFNRYFGTDHDVCALVQDGTTPITQADLSTLSNGSWFDKDQLYPAVDSDGRHFVVAYAEQHAYGNTSDYDIYVDDVYLSGNTLGFAQAHAPIVTSNVRDTWPHVASQWSSGGVSGRTMLQWTHVIGTHNDDVQGAIFDLYDGGAWNVVCAGDGTGTACPCGNTGAFQHGCANSANAQGALLSVSGSTSTLAGTATLSLSGTPPTTTCIFLSSTATSGGVLFGDGLLCTSGPIVRLGSRTTVAGNAAFPGPGGPSTLLTASGVGFDGGTRYYQALYRNNTNFCTSSTFNLSNGVRMIWAR